MTICLSVPRKQNRMEVLLFVLQAKTSHRVFGGFCLGGFSAGMTDKEVRLGGRRGGGRLVPTPGGGERTQPDRRRCAASPLPQRMSAGSFTDCREKRPRAEKRQKKSDFRRLG